MAKGINKKEVEAISNDFFSKIKSKRSEEVKKIKRLVMGNNVKLEDRRKLFCKKCLSPYKTPKIRIKDKVKTITCENCGYVSRWKINKN